MTSDLGKSAEERTNGPQPRFPPRHMLLILVSKRPRQIWEKIHITEEYLKLFKLRHMLLILVSLFKLFPRCGQGEVVEPEALVVGEGRPWLDY